MDNQLNPISSGSTGQGSYQAYSGIAFQSIAPLSTIEVATKPQLTIVLTSDQQKTVLELVQSKPLSAFEDKEIVLFGSERQRALASKLDGILAEITKENSPLLFELFRQLKQGVGDAKIDELEKKIRESLQTRWYNKILDSVGLSSMSKRVKDANETISSMITSKATTLNNVMKGMEEKVQQEVLRLIAESSRLGRLGDEYRQNVVEFGITTEAARKLLIDGKGECEARIKLANASGDPLQVESAKAFQQRIDLFEARTLLLETAYQKAPVELASIRLGQGASLSTLGETANSVLEEFNDIKSALIKISVSFQIKTVQAMNQERRALKAQLQRYSGDLLDEVSVSAAKTRGLNRLEDAQLLLDMANGIKNIGDKIESEFKTNQGRFAEARNKLAETKQILSVIPTH